MSKSMIVGPDGQPLSSGDLTDDLYTPGPTGIYQAWHASLSRGLTPDRLLDILERAAQGDADEYLTVAEEMEERNEHYASVLGTRKRAITRLPMMVEAPTDDAADVAIAEDVLAQTKLPSFRRMLKHSTDGLGKSYAVSRIDWQRTPKKWVAQFQPADPRWFRWDRNTGRELRLKTLENPIDCDALAPYRFIVHVPQIKSGLPIRGGLARLAAVSHLCKVFAKADWMAFLEVFGMPLRLGRYGPSATREDKAILRRAVSQIGADAAAILPESMKIEFIKAIEGGGTQPVYMMACDWIDRQTSKAVLGQTMTADAQSSGMNSSNADVHNAVREDIRDDDALDLEETIQRDFVIPYVNINYGVRDPDKYPRFKFLITKREDLGLLTDALKALVPLGWEVEQSVISDKFGLPAPKKGAKLLAPQTVAAIPPPDRLSDPIPALNRVILNAQQQQLFGQPDQIDQIVNDQLNDQLADWQVQMAEIVDPVQQLASECADEAEFLARLPELLKTVDAATLTRSLAIAAFKAAGLGDASDKIAS